MRRYLIVDDNEAFAENLAEILRDHGAEVTLCKRGAEALEQIRATRFDALLTDMRMPAMNGAQLVHALRSFDPGLPVIVSTAYSGDDDLQTARNEGLLAVLPKPLDVARLLRLLSAARRNAFVALIEDDPRFADNLDEALSDAGFTAVMAGSVLETERLGPVRPFSAVVDLRVAGGPDGEAMKRIAQRFPGLPIICSTAHAQVSPPVPVRALMQKPYDPARLLEHLDRLHQEAASR